MPQATAPRGQLDVLVVGAGPTGLALATQLQRFGVKLRIVDRLLDRGHESRALALQARTLEVLQGLGIGERLVARGQPAGRIVVHLDQGEAVMELGGLPAADTRFPFILILSQAETEAVLADHLGAEGIRPERGVELVRFATDGDGVACTLRHLDGREESVRSTFLVGCDGAHSTVRKGAGIAFEGEAYAQDFVLGDVEADGPTAGDTLHAFARWGGVSLFFPLGQPSTWRVISVDERGARPEKVGFGTGTLTLAQLQEVVDVATGGDIQLHDPSWLRRFHLSHRQTSHYRAGPVFLAGDAAHIHSPVGAQGMNTGIQDAWNLGWKLAFSLKGWAQPGLLDSYEAERWPVGRALLRSTDRAFGLFVRAVSSGPVATWVRRAIVSRVLPRLFGSERLRTWAFGLVSELRIAYRKSPIVAEGEPHLQEGPRAGERLPDAIVHRGGHPTFLQEAASGSCLSLLICGDGGTWNEGALTGLQARYADSLGVIRLSRLGQADGELVAGEAVFQRLGVREAAQYLVRPDGYIAFRCAGTNLGAVGDYLSRWFTAPQGTGR